MPDVPSTAGVVPPGALPPYDLDHRRVLPPARDWIGAPRGAREDRAMRNGGEIIVEYLVREKVPYVFGLCGHGNVGLLDALYDRTDAIRTISTRHEQTAGHMADAYFRVAHRPAATLTSCGPGSANLPI